MGIPHLPNYSLSLSPSLSIPHPHPLPFFLLFLRKVCMCASVEGTERSWQCLGEECTFRSNWSSSEDILNSKRKKKKKKERKRDRSPRINRSQADCKAGGFPTWCPELSSKNKVLFPPLLSLVLSCNVTGTWDNLNQSIIASSDLTVVM